MSGKYRTIVADPPWSYSEGWPAVSTSPRAAERSFASVVDTRGLDPRARRELPYDSMTVDDISALPVEDLAGPNAHLYLWTTNRYLRDAYDVSEAWGFRYSQLLVWAKTPRGIGPGGAFSQNAEYILFARRARFGWDYYGDESLETAEIPSDSPRAA